MRCGATMNPRAIELQQRLLKYSTTIAALCDALPGKLSARRIAGQLIDSSSSSYANYRSACRGRSRAEFIAKLGIVVEELDESEGWLILLQELQHIRRSVSAPLLSETNELLSIFSRSILTAKMGSGPNHNK
ncbi:MAG TPA: four helix bundle protein [Vicinamibacterales bacterium]|jgi:four helix bundle protein|nr:four helix bundle protein [Vicinamibacterales bacterium]